MYTVATVWPSGFVTVTVTVPALPAGTVTSSCVAANDVTGALAAPKVTVTPAR